MDQLPGVLKISVSGVRGIVGEGLTPPVVFAFACAHAEKILQDASENSSLRPQVVIGTDTRPSRHWIKHILIGVYQALGIEVVDLARVPTPTVGVNIRALQSAGGVSITASHNPLPWNALKFFSAEGTFLSPEEMDALHHRATTFLTSPDALNRLPWQETSRLGNYHRDMQGIARHVQEILHHPLIERFRGEIYRMGFRVVVDPVNSAGYLAVQHLLRELQVQDVHWIHASLQKPFERDPEPSVSALDRLVEEVQRLKADVGFALDPDADRLVLVAYPGVPLPEEQTQVFCADFVLAHLPGPVVTNVASSSWLRLLAEKYHVPFAETPVGEFHVVQKMKETGASIGGEGNGGVIFPGVHPGRDALTGIALILAGMSWKRCLLQDWWKQMNLPELHMVKTKVSLPPHTSIPSLLSDVNFRTELQNLLIPEDEEEIDGIKFFWNQRREWLLLRPSNTEPVLRILAEGENPEVVQERVRKVRELLKKQILI